MDNFTEFKVYCFDSKKAQQSATHLNTYNLQIINVEIVLLLFLAP